MRICADATLEKVGEKYIVFVKGSDKASTDVIMLNSSSAWLWQQMAGLDFSRDDALKAMLEHFDVTKERAELDLDNWLHTLSDEGLIKE